MQRTRRRRGYGFAISRLVSKGPPCLDAQCEKESQAELLRRMAAHWINAVMPVAEQEGIRLAVHPNDPPVEKLGGVPQLLRSFDALKRLMLMRAWTLIQDLESST